MELSSQEKDVLLKIYVGQNIREHGMIEDEIDNREILEVLLSKDLVERERWYSLRLFSTTYKGSKLGRTLIKEKIEKESIIQEEIKKLPRKLLDYFIKYYIRYKLVFTIDKQDESCYSWEDSWKNHIFTDDRIQSVWDKLFRILISHGLCIETHYYVSTNGGELTDLYYTISQEIQKFLISLDSTADLSIEEHALRTYHFIYDNEKLIDEYNDTYSRNGEPFEILDPITFKIYLERNLLQPVINSLLNVDKGDLLNEEAFFLIIRDFEQSLREFIKQKLGGKWEYRIKNDQIYMSDGKRKKTKIKDGV